MPFERIDDFPAELVIPALRQYIFVEWFRIKGGVYTYIEKILARFRGELHLNAKVQSITRSCDDVTIALPEGQQQFDKVVFATPPDQVMALLADPTPAERQRFSSWQANRIRTFLHSDTAMYDRYNITQPSEFDFFQTETGLGLQCLSQSALWDYIS